MKIQFLHLFVLKAVLKTNH